MRFALLALLVCSSLMAADYHVASSAAEGGDGTARAPFRTIAEASAKLQPGDRCIIHEGTYRETLRPARSGEAGKPISYVAAPNAGVTISGTDPITGDWQNAAGVATIAVAGKVEQLFASGRMMPEARWPNCTPEQFMDYPRAAAGEGTGYEELVDAKLPAGDATGGVVLIWNGDRWWSSTRRIAGYSAGKSLRFDKTYKPEKQDPYHQHDPYKPKAGNPYIIFGARNLLDAPGEWFHDGQTLHFMPISGIGEVEIRRRELGVDLSGLSHIQVSGISFFAAGASLKDSVSCRVEDSHFRYMEYTRDWSGPSTPGPVVSGSDNEFRRCSFGRTSGPALRVRGENNRVLDCVVFDTAYMGGLDGAITAATSVGATISNCTILRTARDGILHGDSRKITITHNDISNVDLLNSDSGGIYCWGTDGTGSVIAYNHVHDNTGDMNVGIYIDNFCKGFTVHHNLSWNNTGAGITLNSDAENHTVVNNTLAHNGKTFATFAYAGKTLTQKGTRIINNLVTGPMRTKDPWSFAQGELAPVLQNNAKASIGEDGMPVTGSAAIDAGIEVAGITDGFAGKAPDLGAYEVGGKRWTAGASWAPADMPKGVRTSIAWAPLPEVTASTMIRDGLILWLDASDLASVKTDAGGKVTRWVDKSGKRHDATPANPAKVPVLKSAALANKAMVGGGAFKIATGTINSKAVSVVMVARATEPGRAWERLAAGWTGSDKDWIAPNWTLLIPNAEKPTAFEPAVFMVSFRERTVANLTIGGTAMTDVHDFSGDLAEVLVYSRALNDEEQDALDGYLKRKWGLAE